MAIENILMPQLGESVTEGTIEKWLVKPGDTVNKYDPLAEVNTDKVTAEVPSSFAGTIKELIAQEGETLAVGEIICTIEIEGSVTVEAPVVAAPAKEEPANEVPAASSQKPVESLHREKGKAAGRYSPAVLRLSQDNGIDLTLVEGSGKEGRITRKDLLAIIESGNIPTAAAAPVIETPAPVASVPAATAAAKAAEPVNAPVAAGDIEIPVTGVRRAIASNMLRSKHEAPHAWMMIEVDVTNLVQYRDSLKNDFKQKEGFNLTYFAFFVKAVAQALKEFPMMNSMWAGDKIVLKKTSTSPSLSHQMTLCSSRSLIMRMKKQLKVLDAKFRSLQVKCVRVN